MTKKNCPSERIGKRLFQTETKHLMYKRGRVGQNWRKPASVQSDEGGLVRDDAWQVGLSCPLHVEDSKEVPEVHLRKTMTSIIWSAVWKMAWGTGQVKGYTTKTTQARGDVTGTAGEQWRRQTQVHERSYHIVFSQPDLENYVFTASSMQSYFHIDHRLFGLHVCLCIACILESSPSYKKHHLMWMIFIKPLLMFITFILSATVLLNH